MESKAERRTLASVAYRIEAEVDNILSIIEGTDGDAPDEQALSPRIPDAGERLEHLTDALDKTCDRLSVIRERVLTISRDI